MVDNLKIIWSRLAVLQLQRIYIYIKEDAPQNADKVKALILASVKDLLKQPQKHPPDKFKLNNDGSFRAYHIFRYRIAYQVIDTSIVILRVRHASMEPLPY